MNINNEVHFSNLLNPDDIVGSIFSLSIADLNKGG